MEDGKHKELYELTVDLFEYVEIEYKLSTYDFNDISKKIFLKNILEELNKIRVISKSINEKENN